MKLSDAAERIGQKVIYSASRITPPEEGVITSVNHRYVFVRYGADVHSKATDADCLTLLAGDPR